MASKFAERLVILNGHADALLVRLYRSNLVCLILLLYPLLAARPPPTSAMRQQHMQPHPGPQDRGRILLAHYIEMPSLTSLQKLSSSEKPGFMADKAYDGVVKAGLKKYPQLDFVKVW
jgi:hypothetical protein